MLCENGDVNLEKTEGMYAYFPIITIFKTTINLVLNSLTDLAHISSQIYPITIVMYQIISERHVITMLGNCFYTRYFQIPVRRRRRLQGRNQRVPDQGTGRKWLLWRGGASHPNPHGNHHHGDEDPGGFGRQGPPHSRIDVRSAEEVQLPGTFGRAVRGKGCDERAVRYCSG